MDQYALYQNGLLQKALDQLVPESYRACRRYARRSGSNFVPAFRILPKKKRQAMEAVYAFMHFTDELADSKHAEFSRRGTLRFWKQGLTHFLNSPTPQDALCDCKYGTDEQSENLSDRCYVGVDDLLTQQTTVRTCPCLLLEGRKSIFNGYGKDPIPELLEPYLTALIYILPAIHDVIHRYEISPDPFLAVIDGVEQDLDFKPFPDFEALSKYCDCVATAVGLACLPIWGTIVPEEEYVESARAAGLAFQLTNILRDVREDAENGRVYIPVDELQAAGFSDAEEFMQAVLRPAGDERFEPLLQSQCRRVQAIYKDAAQLNKALSRDGRRIYQLMFDAYHGLFSIIEKEPTQVLYGKVRSSFREKLRIAGKVIFHNYLVR